MKPPFQLTPAMNLLVAEISLVLGRLQASTLDTPSPKLRKQNRIRTVKSTLAIEGNTFTEEQITALLENKRVVGSPQEIQEVRNAVSLYDQIDGLHRHRVRDFLKAHGVLMKGLVKTPGKFRSRNVEVLAGSRVKHIAPKANRVPELVEKLFRWLKEQESVQHPLILGAVAHYEIEFIHPFEDGNGRMGRFWQSLYLVHCHPLFRYVPVESLIEKNQADYYAALGQSDQAGESTVFIEFMLKVIRSALEELSAQWIPVTQTGEIRLERARSHFEKTPFSRKQYLALFKNISTATASRDLQQGVERGLLKKTGEKNQTRYRYR